VAEALADSDPKWDIGWGMADPLAERVPLQVILDCLQARMVRRSLMRSAGDAGRDQVPL
jgi:hypothetical protein